MHAMSFASSTMRWVSVHLSDCASCSHFEISRICAQLHSCPSEAHALNLVPQFASADVTPVARWSSISSCIRDFHRHTHTRIGFATSVRCRRPGSDEEYNVSCVTRGLQLYQRRCEEVLDPMSFSEGEGEEGMSLFALASGSWRIEPVSRLVVGVSSATRLASKSAALL